MKALKSFPGARAVRRGFTLVEILAATAIMVVLMVLILGLTTNVLTVWNRSSGQLQANVEARVILDILSQDFVAAVLRNDNAEWIRSQPRTAGTVGDTPWPNTWLMFYSPVLDPPDDDNNPSTPVVGDICAVSYFPAHQNPFDGTQTNPNIYALCRGLKSPAATFNGPITNEVFDLSSYWSGQAERDDVESFLAGNIVRFQVSFTYRTSGAKPPGGWPATSVGDTVRFFDGEWLFPGKPANFEEMLWIDVTITSLSDEGQAVMLAAQNGLNQYDPAVASDFREIVDLYGQTFTRRIDLISSPL